MYLNCRQKPTAATGGPLIFVHVPRADAWQDKSVSLGRNTPRNMRSSAVHFRRRLVSQEATQLLYVALMQNTLKRAETMGLTEHVCDVAYHTTYIRASTSTCAE